MTSPRRWLDAQTELPPDLLRAMRGAPAEPGAAELQELANRLGASLGVALAPPSAAALPGAVARGTSLLRVLGTWLAGGMALGVAFSTAMTYTAGAPDEPKGAASPALSRRVGASAHIERVPVTGAPAPSVTARALPVAPPPTALAVPGSTRGIARAASPEEPPVLEPQETELSLLQRAHAAMAADPARALALSRLHEKAFPRGLLAQEREVIAIDALLRLGRAGEARAFAQAFEQRYPGSAHARRVQQLLEGAQ